MKTKTLIIALILPLFACQGASELKSSATNPSNSDRTYLLEKIGGNEFAIARTYLDEFDQLTNDQKITLYYLTRAAIAGRDIYYDQRHKDAIKVRSFFETLITSNKLSNPLKSKVEEYLKYIWINNSQYHTRTGLKLKPNFSFDELKAAVADQDLTWLQAVVFDTKHQPVLTNLTPKPEEGDIIQASANNIYDANLHLKEVEALDTFWLTKLNVRFQKVDEKIVPQPYKVGGVYGEQLARVNHFLKLALNHAEDSQKPGIEKLIQFYETGDEETFKQASIAWLKSQPKVDTINGFIESYMDPRQTVGSWEGIAYHISEDPVLKEFSNHVQYFEDHMPWKDEYKRKNITSKPVATLINVATAIGEGGPVTWSGINLPNYQDIRTEHGSKNVVLTNMIEARNQVNKDMLLNEFYRAEHRDVMKTHYKTAYQMLLFMHEVIGHGSGAADANLKGDPRNSIGQNYGAWEEARASLVAWHHIADPKLAEFGAFDVKNHKDVMTAFYLKELQDQLLTLRNAEHEDILREAHDRADQLIFEYVRQNSNGGFEVVNENGKFFVKINDVNAIHKTASQLLTIVHEAKATGNKTIVDEYLTKYGNTFNKEWRDNIIARANQIGLPKATAMVFPKLVPVLENGTVVGVKIDHNESFTEQQLRLGKISASTEVSANLY